MTLYKWQEAYQAACLEFHTEHLKKKIGAAEHAVTERYRELQGSSDHTEERVLLNEAVKALRTIQIQRLGYPLVEESEENNP